MGLLGDGYLMTFLEELNKRIDSDTADGIKDGLTKTQAKQIEVGIVHLLDNRDFLRGLRDALRDA